MRAPNGSSSIVLLIHNIGDRYCCVGQRHAPAALHPRKEPHYLLCRRLGAPQVLFGRV